MYSLWRRSTCMIIHTYCFTLVDNLIKCMIKRFLKTCAMLNPGTCRKNCKNKTQIDLNQMYFLKCRGKCKDI